MRTRCHWVKHELDIPYHDNEWAVPVHDDRTHFEFITLEGAQAGLSWLTILKKRDNYRAAFDNFAPELVALYNDMHVETLLQNPGIIRNKLKIRSTIQNARAFLAIQEAYGSFDTYIWQFTNGRPLQNAWKTMDDVPAVTPQAEAMSKALKKQGFNFVGPTICYAYMQAVGMVNDHTVDCYRYEEVKKMG